MGASLQLDASEPSVADCSRAKPGLAPRMLHVLATSSFSSSVPGENGPTELQFTAHTPDYVCRDQ